jgi:cell wall-associated NlpC family hydrolase
MGNGAGYGEGQAMVNFAMQYVGYPYVYAGEGPYAFDCSGFTKFVAQNTLGVDITHDMFTQIGMGQSINMNGLQPGDLVFFSNTFRPGLSHVGIYIGGGQFVHAENESTGVVVSDLNSDYYGSRWAGGTRLA